LNRDLSPLAIVAQAQAALGAGDAAGFVALLAEGVTMTVQGTTAVSGVFTGPAEILAWFGRIAPRITAARVEPIAQMESGEWVITRDRVEATTIAGRTYRNEYLRLWRCVGGLCVEMVEYLDTEAVTRDLLGD
jgi:ketosteroid isomerase-like protein